MIFSNKTLRIEFIFLALIYSFFVWFFSDSFSLAHESGGALYLSSDGPGYYKHYLIYIDNFGAGNITSYRFFEFLLNKSPIALLVLFSGDVGLVILCSGVLAIFSVYVLLSCLDSIVLKRRIFLLLFFVPFFSFSFFSINKEIYVGSATVLFLSYILSKEKKIFFYSFIVALIGKPLFALILILAFVGFNFFNFRYFLLFWLFLLFTVLPFSGISIPGAPNFQLHEDAGRFSKFTTLMISNGAYVIAYPIKYVGNILLKVSTAFSVGAFDRQTIYLDLLTSVTFAIQLMIILVKRRLICSYKTGKVLFFFVIFLPVPLLFFNFSQVRYIYFIQIFCVYLIAMLPFYRKTARQLSNINKPSGEKFGV